MQTNSKNSKILENKENKSSRSNRTPDAAKDVDRYDDYSIVDEIRRIYIAASFMD